ncbi:MAG: UDP-3-O-[3-hydroxymyristoyl] N-acetylglucosamine deacetylase [Candidatus Kuenenia sp.]|nr:UDP-3-O-[3-hydroxymyristoyl] N-acetylglucosamine deacetylase [Candidatus Kuenenia hertensis]
MDTLQKTIGKPAECSGTGMFRGESVRIAFKPAPANSGINFVRVDLPHRPKIPANVHFLSSTVKRVFLKKEDAEVEGIEHLMAALAGLGIDNLEIEIHGREVPAGDGSAKYFMDVLREAKIVNLDGKKQIFKIQEPITVINGKASIVALPHDEGLFFSYTLDFDGFFIEQQTYEMEFNEEIFSREVASARTFGLSTYVEEFKKMGLGKGITDENSFIIHEDGKITKPLSMNPAELRFPNEHVRHKILDLIGDLYLANVGIQGHIVAKRSGHSLNVELARKIANISHLKRKMLNSD